MVLLYITALASFMTLTLLLRFFFIYFHLLLSVWYLCLNWDKVLKLYLLK